ncbi:MAG TPA: ABC transporter ATP-binding protein [Tepidisphaeraceae bacterium]|nr:ABC transporter ATP-binding protein [Tepidisphaeraceae bacterium]
MSTTPQAMQPTATKALIRVAGLRKSFRMGDSIVEVLRNVDLTVREGEFLAIEGRSGSGKSTLMHLLGALDVVDGGTIDYEGTEFGSMSAAERSRLRNRHFGFVFQFYHLLPELNVLENTLLAPMIELSWRQFRAKRAELREQAASVLEQLGMGHRLKHRPATLSGGERQRVAIARALMNTPRVLFADEPTGNLDTETGRQIMDVLEKLHREKGQTILMVTHDRSLAVEADRALLLQNGRLVNERK